jgi:hypothetical protein
LILLGFQKAIFAKNGSKPKLAKVLTNMKQFLLDILRQLFGTNSRKGKLTISWFANVQMNDLHLDLDTIEDVFRKGRKVESIVQSYGDYSISISYRWDENKKQYVITSVRKYENQERRWNKYPRWERR